MILHRTVSGLAVLEHGQQTLLFPWEQLLALRQIVKATPSAAANAEDFPRQVREPWATSGSTFGIALMHTGGLEIHLEAEEWDALASILYVNDVLLTPTDIALLTDRPQSRVSEAIAKGDIFAFQVPGLDRRQWKIPKSVAEEWGKER